MSAVKTIIKSIKRMLLPWIPPIFLSLYSRIGLFVKTENDININAELMLPQRSLESLFPGIEKIVISLPVNQINREKGMLPLEELCTLAAICKYNKPIHIFEIGTYRGSSTLLLAMSTSPESLVFTLDLPPTNRETQLPLDIGDITGLPFIVGEQFLESDYEKKIKQLYGDSSLFNFSPFHEKIDMVFIDGNHGYENVKIDSQNAFRMLTQNGIIIWDDYHQKTGPGVMKALNEFKKTKQIFRVKDTRFAIYLNHI